MPVAITAVRTVLRIAQGWRAAQSIYWDSCCPNITNWQIRFREKLLGFSAFGARWRVLVQNAAKE